MIDDFLLGLVFDAGEGRRGENAFDASFTADERRILSWSGDKTLRLWDAARARRSGRR
jgi:hypothetical protein